MKYCTKCGKELMDEAVICPNCGCAVAGINVNNGMASNQQIGESKASTAFMLSVIGLFVCGFLGIIGIAKANESKNYTGGEFCPKAKKAFVIGIIDVVGWALILMVSLYGH